MQISKKRWLIQSTGGLLFTSAGLCMCIDAGLQKSVGSPWFMYGVFALILFNGGLCLLIDAGARYIKR